MRVRTLAIHPHSQLLSHFAKMPPLGMLWIGGELRKVGCEVEFLDQQVDTRDPGAIVGGMRPHLVLIGGTSHSRFMAFDIARLAKAACPETFVVYGGPHASFCAEDTLRAIPEIDVIAHGEGEEVCVELAEWVREGRFEQLEKIDGISFRKTREQIIRTPDRGAIKDLDALGAPARDLVQMSRYDMKLEYLQGVSGTSIITARGCPIMCTFCSASAMFGRTYRARSPKAVVDEIEGLVQQHGFRGVKIFDSTFTLSRRHVEGFCDELRRRGLNIFWECEVRADTLNKALLERMRAAGCYYIDVGVESGAQRVLDECVRKRITLAQVESVLRWAKELGILTKAFFTVGHPNETFAEAKDTNRFIWKHRKLIRQVGHRSGISIYPGTYVEEFARQHGLLPMGFQWSNPYSNPLQDRLLKTADNVPILVQPGLGLDDLRRIRVRYICMRLASPVFVWEKLCWLLRTRALGKYVRLIMPRFRMRHTQA